MNKEIRGPDNRKRAKKPTGQKGDKKPNPSIVLGQKDLVERFNASSKRYTKAINRILEDSGIDPKEAD